MKPISAGPTAPKTRTHTYESNSDLLEQIRRRAYELYEQRGREDGGDLDDWLQAESEVTEKKAQTAAV
jgi:hypothetical protein